jgi:transposase-like protein
MHCQRKYTPEPKQQGYPEGLRKRAVEMYVDGMNLRKIARHLKVHHRTVALWVVDQAEALPNAPMPDEVKDAEGEVSRIPFVAFTQFSLSLDHFPGGP